MATSSKPLSSLIGEDLKEKEPEERDTLLDRNEVLIVSKPRDFEDGLALGKSSTKKVQLPEESGAVAGGGRFTIGPAPEQDWEMVPPDGRWGWCILVGATLVNILIPGTIKSFGVLFVEFTEVFESSQATASGIPALCYFLYSSLGPLSSILSVRWSYRRVTLIGGSFAAFGMIFSSFASSIMYLYFSFGALVGTGAGLAFPPTVYIVTSYFVRLRGVANGICISGSAFGSIILPPVLRYLLETYGYRGAVLIMGGIMLNVWAAALLFQPVEDNMIRKSKDVAEEEEGQEKEETIACEMYVSEAQQMKRNPTLNSMENGDFVKPTLICTLEYPNPLDKEKKVTGSPPIEFHNCQNVDLEIQRSVSSTHMDSRRISQPNSKYVGIPEISSKTTLNSASLALESVPEGKLGMLGSGKKLNVPKTPKRSPSTSSFQYMSTPFHGSTLSAFQQPAEFASQFSLKSITESIASMKYCCGFKKRPTSEHKTKKEPNKFFDINLLKDPTYLVILISNCTCAISYTNFIILVPSYALSLSFDKGRGAYLLSIISALDLVGRIGGSAISDAELIPKPWFFIGGLFVSGLSLAIMPFVTTYTAISVCCSIFGLASGINVGVTALIMAEMLGTERLMSTYGISLFCNGILQLIGPPICNIWYEREKSYKSLFITLGFILIGGAALWGFIPVINRRKKQRELKSQQLEQRT